MKLQQLADTLALMPADAPVRLDSGVGVRGLISWRGRYEELTLYHCDGDDPITAGDLLVEANEALAGKVFYGYKGGDYVMKPHTPVWADDYGDYGSIAVMGITLDGGTVLIGTADLSDYV